MSTYNFTIDTQFLISGTDASGTFSNESYPTISGSLGDVFSFTFFQSEAYAFSIEDTDFENKYDTSDGLTGTTDNFTPSTTGTFLYSNPVDFEQYGNIIVGAETTTTTTTTTTTATTTTDGPTTTTTTTTTIPPIDSCNCGSIDFPASGNLVINGTKYKLLHNQTAYVGEEQKFTTGIDRISESETYPNSLTVDFSKYPVYVSHSIRLVVRTSEHDIIASKYVGVDDTLLKIEKPIKFNNINKGIDLHNKTILLDVESICDYEGTVSCCDQMPSSLFIRDSINTLELIYDPSEAVTTTTTTTTVPPPLSPTNPQRIVTPFTQWAIEPDLRFKSIGSFTNYLYYDGDNYNDFYDVLFRLPVGGVFTPVYTFIQYITTYPSQPDPITGLYTTWEDKEVNLSNFEIQFWDSQVDGWSSIDRQTSFYFKNLIRLSYFDTNNSPVSGGGPYLLFVDSNVFANGSFNYYKSIISRDRRTFAIYRSSLLRGELDSARLLEIETIHTIRYRSRVIINGIPSEWAVNSTQVKTFSYELIWKRLPYLA